MSTPSLRPLAAGPEPAAQDPRRLGGRRGVYALLVWLAALATTLALAPMLERANFVFFWVAVLYAAWHAGYLAALLAAVASVWACDRIFTGADAIGVEGALALGIFLIASGLVSMLASREARGRARLEAAERSLRMANAEMEERNQQLADQAVELESQVDEAQSLAMELEAAVEQQEHAMAEADLATRRTSSVLASLSDIVVSYDADWRVLYLNPSARESVRDTGVDPDELMGQVVWEALPFLLGTRFESETLRAAAEGRAVEYEEYLPVTDRWYENRVIPAGDGTVTTYSRDITARRRAVQALRENEARYRALVEASTQMVWHTTAEGMVEDMPFWRELTGQTLEEVRGNGWTRAIHPADQTRVADTWWRAHERRMPYECEYRLHMRDGSTRWFRARAVAVLSPYGTVQEWVGVLNDVDAERRAAAGHTLLDRVYKTLEQAQDAEATLARVARLAVVPPAPVGGVPAEAFADGASIYLLRGGRLECISVESRDDVRRELARSLEAAYPPALDAPGGPGRVVSTGRSELVERFDPARIAVDGEHLQRLRALGIYSALVVPVRVRGEALGALALVLHGPHRRRPYNAADLAVAEELARRVGVALDNAARVLEAEEERTRAEAANRAKSDFLASMSHELRTPLNAIAGYTELMELGLHGPVSDQQREALGRIQRAQRVLLRLVNDVLNLARLEAGAVEYELAAVPLDGLLAEVEALMAPQVGARGLTLRMQVADPTPVARADRDKTQQILLNLLSNAVKFTEPGGAVRLLAETCESGVMVRVEDTGRGIPADKLEAIFAPFVQVDQGYTRTTDGTGLGLAISRDLARAMGGDIRVTSQLGAGATFILSLPRGE